MQFKKTINRKEDHPGLFMWVGPVIRRVLKNGRGKQESQSEM